MGICANDKITAEIDGDFSIKYYDPTPISDELVWSSSDTARQAWMGKVTLPHTRRKGFVRL